MMISSGIASKGYPSEANPTRAPISDRRVNCLFWPYNENAGTNLNEQTGKAPQITLLGTTQNIWDTPDRLSFHSGGNGHARIVSDAQIDAHFDQSDIDGIGHEFFVIGHKHHTPVSPQRMFQYGGKTPDPTTGGLNCRYNTNGTIEFASHPDDASGGGTDLALASSVLTDSQDYVSIMHLDRTVAGQVTGTWYHNEDKDTTSTVTQGPPGISPDSGTLRGLELHGRPTNPPDSRLADPGQVFKMMFIKFYFDITPELPKIIRRLSNADKFNPFI